MAKTKLKKVAWAPQPKQARALSCPVTELFFGGAAGGGKSDFLLADFLRGVEYGSEHVGILFRKTFPQLEELIRRSWDIYRPMGAEYRAAEHSWTFPGGALLRFRHLESDMDVHDYQGHQFCVGINTPILMGDGSVKAARTVRIGDSVMTLEGPRMVIDAISPYLADCVKVGNQINPKWHAILTEQGWQSYASLRDNYAKEIDEEYQGFAWHQSVSVRVKRATRIRWEGGHGKSREYYFAYKWPISCYEKDGKSVRLSLSSFLDSQRVLEQYQLQANLFSAGVPDSVRLDHRPAIDFLGDYHHGVHSDGEPFRRDQDIGRWNTHKLDDAEARSLGRCVLDSRDNILRCIPKVEDSYPHPYADEERKAEWESISEALEFTPIGKRFVCDFTVEDANHYITPDGIVNKNTWEGWDELTNWTTDYPYIWMFSRLRSATGRPCRVRSAANPGGSGHGWVKQRFIEIGPPETIYRDPETGIKRIFIPAHLEDNLALMRADPDYERRLQALYPQLYRAYRFGDWDILSGQVFEEFRAEEHIVDAFPLDPGWYRFASLDWGYAKPFSIGWWAIDHDGRMIRYREWYGCEKGKHDVGVRLAAKEVAAEAWKLSVPEGCSDMVADPSCWNKMGLEGNCIAEEFAAAGWTMEPAINDRVGGWGKMHTMLKTLGSDGRPMMIAFHTCPSFRRIIPVLVADERHPEDVDTKQEDHLGDEVRYACMSPLSKRTSRPDTLREPGGDAQKPYDVLRWGLEDNR